MEIGNCSLCLAQNKKLRSGGRCESCYRHALYLEKHPNPSPIGRPAGNSTLAVPCRLCQKSGAYLIKGLCRACYSKSKYAELAENPEWRKSRAEKAMDWNRRNPGKVLENKKASYRGALLRRYGLSEESYIKMVEDCGSRCALCQRENRKLVVDHNHATGEVRKLLCNRCNFFVGLIETSPIELVHDVLQYTGVKC